MDQDAATPPDSLNPPDRNTYPLAYATPRAAIFGGMRDYAGGSAQAMTAAFVGFGAIAHDIGLSPAQGVITSPAIALVPAQMAMADLMRGGAGLAAILLAVAFISARLLPMSMALMPILRQGARRRGILYFAAYPLASTAWAYAMRRCPAMPPDQRLPYFLAFALSNITIITLGTALGYALADHLPVAITSALVLVTPVFFILLFISDSPHRSGILSLALGAVLGPPILTFSPEWGLLATGLLAGTLGFCLWEIWSRFGRRRDG